MSLEELLQVNIRSPATQVRMDLRESPASITSLSANEIRRTPARNIMDLIEIYIPGAIWMNSEEGPLVGMRGSVASRNNKYLLLVNGKAISTKGMYGAKSEIEQWDMGDIQRLDIIRGPGSVTWGPGAVAGVIAITTQDAATLRGGRLAAGYVHEYGSTGIKGSLGHAFPNGEALVYASLTRTVGHYPLNYQGSNNFQPGYLGRDIRTDGAPLDYFADYQDQPQAKVLLDARVGDHWSGWARYTQQGATWSGNEGKTLFDGKLVNQQSVRDRQFSGEANYQGELNPRLRMEVKAGLSLFDLERRIDEVRNPDPDHPSNFRYNFSETEYMLGARLNFAPRPGLEGAIGAEITVDSMGPGWFDAPESMRMGGDGRIISGPGSPIYQLPYLTPEAAVFAGDGWSTLTHSVFVEGKADLGSIPTLLLSARVDKNSYSQWLLSPRAALLLHMGDRNILKAIVQRSSHRNESGELFIEHRNGTTPSHETVDAYEVIYQAKVKTHASTTLSAYYTDGEIIDWNPVADRNLPLGRLQLAGIEAEWSWAHLNTRWGANYSLLQLIDWRMAPGVTSTGISYSDYNQVLRGSSAVQTGYGKDLNNWPNQALKLFGDLDLEANLVLHGDAQFFWDYQGALDGLAALERASRNDPAEARTATALQKVRQEGVFGLNSRINLSVQYIPSTRVKVTAAVLNLLGTGTNQRYAFDEGNSRLTPHRVRFVREERAISLTLGYGL